jgi:hypothetical protein
MVPLRRFNGQWWVAAAALLLAAACDRPAASSKPAIRLVEGAENHGPSYVEVTGLDAAARSAVGQLAAGSPDWVNVLAVRVVSDDGTASATPIAGRYAVDGHSLRFTPLFPFDPGRQYEVQYYGAGHPADARPAVRAERVALPSPPPSEPTRVTQVFPSGDVVPENQLRMYIHFSAPMGRRGGVEHVRLLDKNGRDVVDPFLPLDAEFWNADRTRYTVFFDPGRQKRGILPNREMGPSLVEGREYTLVVDRTWIDGHGKPLAETFTRRFRVGPAAMRPLDYTGWRVTPPAAGTRDALSVAFPESLDHGLLLRAVGVRRDGQPVVGDVRVEAHETRWVLTPRDPWASGRYELIALSILEDLAGNRIGRAFEVRAFDRAEKAGEPAVTSIPFTVAD